MLMVLFKAWAARRDTQICFLKVQIEMLRQTAWQLADRLAVGAVETAQTGHGTQSSRRHFKFL